MVKRLRRSPLTAESGVRFPLRLPGEKTALLPSFVQARNVIGDGACFFSYRAKRKFEFLGVPRKL